MKIHAPKSHPRYLSNYYRDLISDGVKSGVTAIHGLIAHGRGETFDYLIGEKTEPFATDAVEAATALLLLARRPIISVNGNTAVLVPKELVAIANLLDVPLEVNLFHRSKKRERLITDHLKNQGATTVLQPDTAKIHGINSNRRLINKKGQFEADVVFVPLEDGDRTEALIKMGKKVITVDLNPLSRTAQKATITIVDNIIRALPLLIKTVKKFQQKEESELRQIVKNYNNKLILSQALQHIHKRLHKQ